MRKKPKIQFSRYFFSNFSKLLNRVDIHVVMIVNCKDNEPLDNVAS